MRFSRFQNCMAKPPRLLILATAAASAMLGPALVRAQDAGAVRGSGLVPSLVVSESYTRGNGVIGGAESGEFVTRVSPGLRWSGRSGRVRGDVNYALDAIHYSKRTDATEVTNRLNANVQAEAIEQFAFVDLQANIGQSAISATGQQFAFDDFGGDANRTEVANVQISPYIIGELGGFATYQVRLGAGFTRARDVPSADSDTRSALVSLSSPRSAGQLGWGLSAQRQDLSFRDGRDTTTDRVSGSVSWRPDVDWRFFLTAGQERTNIGNIISRTYDNYGGGLNWSPSPRTRVALQAERRYFGNSYSASFEHRTPRTVWRYSDSRDATTGGDPNGFGQPVTLFDLFFLQFASNFPDPVQREAAVRDFLRLLGRDPNELLNIGALVNAASVQRRQELSAAWSGLRTTVTVQASATELQVLDNPADPSAPPVIGTGNSRQRGLTASVSYRLTPRATATASATYQTSPSGTQFGSNSLQGISFGLNTTVSRTARLNVSARYSDYTSGTDPYQETALTAALSLSF